MDHFLKHIERENKRQQELLDAPPPAPPIEEKNEHPDSPIFNKLIENKTIATFTNFNKNELLDLYQRCIPFFAAARGRGPRPKTSNLDSLIVLLSCYKSGLDSARLAAAFNIKEPTLRDLINRVRPILNVTLRDTWWNRRMRPSPAPGNYPHVALLIDSTSLEVFRPHGRFDEAKIYFDGKNGIYALKKEVAVMANAPHYALFSSAGFVGSRHDYQHFKTNYEVYLEYLTKTLDERKAIPNDAPAFWSVCLDKGYIGPAEDTPEIRRITPRKVIRDDEEKKDSEHISALRVKVECFFGRMTSIWLITKVNR